MALLMHVLPNVIIYEDLTIYVTKFIGLKSMETEYDEARRKFSNADRWIPSIRSTV
jgi:hypothetical protein